MGRAGWRAGGMGAGALGGKGAGSRGVGALGRAGARVATRPGQGPRYGHYARLCTPGCAQLGQVGTFVHPDSVFDPV